MNKGSRFILNTSLAVLRGIYAPMKRRPIRKKTTIISRQSDEPSMDIALLADYLRQNHPDMELKVMCHMLEGRGKLGYVFHMLRQMWNMSNSPVVVLDGYCIAACVLDHRRETEIVQMWHALTAVKKFGYQTVGRVSGRTSEIAEIMRMHCNYDHILCPGSETGKLFCEAFRARQEQLLPLGLPRIDRILNPEKKTVSLREEYGIPADKEVLLYAPTFRRNDSVRPGNLLSVIDPDRFVLVVCLHPLDEDTYAFVQEPDSPLRVIIERRYSTYDWLAECDRIITDYSALGVEAALTGKPVCFYVYDIEEYGEKTGLNIDPRVQIPQATALTGGQLAELLRRPYDREGLQAFRDKYVEIDTNNCTERLGEYIYGMAEEAL